MRTENKQKLIKEIKKLNKEEKYLQVIDILSDEVLEKYNDSELYAELSEAMFKVERDGFETYANKSIELIENAKAFYYLGNYYEQIKDFERGIYNYKKAISLDSNHQLSYASLGDIFIEQNKIEEAETYYLKALDIDSMNPYTNHMLANLYKKQNKFYNAEKHYKIAIKSDSSYYYSHYGLGNIYLLKKEYKIAEEEYKKALKIEPVFLDAIFALGVVYHHQKDFDKAIEYYKKYIEKNEDVIGYNNIGNSYKKKNDYLLAEESYKKALKINKEFEKPYFNLGNLYYRQEKYKEAKNLYKKYLELKKEKDSLVDFAKGKIEKINKILANEDYEKIQELVSKIKGILEYKDKYITHFTSLSVAKLLVFENSKFRLSEGAYLNDTSEGRELFSFLNYQSPFGKKENPVDEIFVQKPFIGSFVSENKHNDLTMWRMYGKEGKDEAKGCAITMSVDCLIENIQEELEVNHLEDNEFEIKFYKVAYWKDNRFIIPDEKIASAKIKNLNKYCNELKKALDEFNLKDEEIKIQIDVEELLFEIAFLFKGIEYQYENEVRLVQKGILFNKIIDKKFSIPRVYIELGDISNSIKKITLGPKVERADEWASAFYYELKNRDIDPEVHISRQPFK
ncbi:tetratricopeptide repeat protein [Chryseobacterium sp. Y16C]|uniref:tetratricopeptide repeat protein n=1 Tax=Chryseobacterium sp. Y16C TaxID=2920939 RepID=UPI001F0B2B3F|nr:tetratricopeptide repeat protein [Chryseobacterium sp. Y16C]UMQ40679.1 tetratricopeptide repeat protein [Chryseobacterium sp. Y16C]